LTHNKVCFIPNDECGYAIDIEEFESKTGVLLPLFMKVGGTLETYIFR
jgi:hypothetical protein